MTTGAPPPIRPARPRRSGPLRFLPLAIAAWLVLEIWLLTLVAGATSGFVVFLLLVGGLVLGSAVIKRAGRRAFRKLSEAVQQQQSGVTPARETGGGGALTMLGGLLIILPGLISDALGLILLIPPVQKALGKYAERTFERKVREATPGGFGDAYQQARMHRPDGKVVQGEVIRDDEPPMRSPRPDDPQLPH
ncbi:MULTISPECIES: FxsA family membrane protein [Streptomyces]|uniref:FxsA family protein n=1 Tax=Streptomyces venezuelae TaxID=54571 RepID=A0A5P2B6D8_STRVZ|nr:MULTISPECIES: FxsA family membrane protein [Streptomyces]NDZ99671.1 FxsA family protein [Streptomyces sp. SID10116]MYY86069.1 FxsA family protein [Streptomyces sp. SID335]MYZ17003.1 FxsA family protein [Streptomyces sp. SID337]NDZ85097.1 FxsA family protein [Streptomyces sp. SID10115]NEB47479.1 FxsA family protein [Streptomyces sp. SID339]